MTIWNTALLKIYNQLPINTNADQYVLLRFDAQFEFYKRCDRQFHQVSFRKMGSHSPKKFSMSRVKLIVTEMINVGGVGYERSHRDCE
ncbi:MAG: hypothetical protein RMX68_027070 [Aulosira sp. ZfuVER01]|nr:hypothetical protein [Aulosira sp. ZfuVER01]MDZ7996690.1 hypothetical protein [Aulosira sp. DedVER01a]MDZ8053740.1 hypothetical protein [Aulosira sp. ZfuCHP01]